MSGQAGTSAGTSAGALRTGTPAPTHEAVRQRLMAALQQRAAQHQGETRRLIEARLQQLGGPPTTAAPTPTSASTAALPAAQPSAVAAAASRAGEAGTAGLPGLAGLLAHIAQHAAPEGELRALQGYRASWARLQMEQRLVQTLAQVPGQAGPLNTQRLLHQALSLMRHAAPGYLQQFMQQVDSLLVLDQLAAAPPAVKKVGARPTRAR